MTNEEYTRIISLLEKGFTPEQIIKLSISPDVSAPTFPSGETPPDTDGDNAAAQEPSSDIPPTPSPSVSLSETDEPSGSEGTAATKDKSSDEVLAAIADLKKTVQANNIKTMSTDTVDTDAELEKALSELIRPSFDRGD